MVVESGFLGCRLDVLGLQPYGREDVAAQLTESKGPELRV